MTHGLTLGIDTRITILAGGLVFLLALVLGIWKYRQMATSENHLAHPYVDIAHRAALLYSFATMLVAVFVQLSAWPTWVNLTAAMVLVAFFVIAIVEYIAHGLKQDTTNQFEHPTSALHAGMIALIVAEVGGFSVLLTGFIAGQLF
jgi:DMSO/TMAO reductase YedYZ heme-binding membrane subunit